MRRVGLVIALSFVVLGGIGCREAAPPPKPAVAATPEVRWVTIDEIAASLPDEPMVIGFDVDDTLLFSSPGFHYGRQKYGDDFLSHPDKRLKFWAEMNTGLDRFSIPKNVARELLALHAERGDTIYFITGRTLPDGVDETVTDILADYFALADPNPVVFSNGAYKKRFIEEREIELFYGDGDGDIKGAIDAGARGIRILRSAASTYDGAHHPGKYEEAVIVDSNR